MNENDLTIWIYLWCRM